jgi:hypothetical protein
MLKLKDKSVVVDKLHAEMFYALGIAEESYTSVGSDCIVTSALDGTHNPGSLHPTGFAVDIRSSQLSDEESRQVFYQLKARLNASGFDVIFEGDHATQATTAPHIHVEYDPKGKPFWVLL